MPALWAPVDSRRPERQPCLLVAFRAKTVFDPEIFALDPLQERHRIIEVRELKQIQVLSNDALALRALAGDLVPGHQPVVEMRFGHNLEAAVIADIFTEASHMLFFTIFFT